MVGGSNPESTSSEGKKENVMNGEAQQQSAPAVATKKLNPKFTSSKLHDSTITDESKKSEKLNPEVTATSGSQADPISGEGTGSPRATIVLKTEKERLIALEAELSEKSAFAANLRRKVENSNRVRLDNKATDFAERIKELDKVIKEERSKQTRLREKVLEQQRIVTMERKGDLELDKEVFDLEIDFKVENLAMHKLEASKIREKIELLEDLQMLKVSAVSAIEKERERREEERKNKLERLLNRIPHLDEAAKQGDGEEYEGVDVNVDKEMVDRVLGPHGDENDDAVFRLGGEVNKMRRKNHEIFIAEHRKAKENVKREKEEVLKSIRGVNVRRKMLEDIVGRGHEFMVKLELGEVQLEEINVLVVDGVEETERGLNEIFQNLPITDENPLPHLKEGQQQERRRNDQGQGQRFDYTAILTTFYETHNKEKLDEVNKTLKKFEGKESELFDNLSKKYKTANPLSATSPVPQPTKSPAETNNFQQASPPLKSPSFTSTSTASALPAYLKVMAVKAKNVIPVSAKTVEKTRNVLSDLDAECQWLKSTKTDAWEEAKNRLDKVNVSKMKKSKESYINEFKSFDVLRALRESQEAPSHTLRDVFGAIGTVLNEVIEEAIKGIYTEVIRFDRFSSKKVDELILQSLEDTFTNASGTAKSEMWYQTLHQLKMDRAEEDKKETNEGFKVCKMTHELVTIDEANDLRASQKKRVQFIPGGSSDGNDSLGAPSVEDDDVTVLDVPTLEQVAERQLLMAGRNNSYGHCPMFNVKSYHDYEKKFFNSVDAIDLEIPVPRGVGGITELALSPQKSSETTLLLAGTTRGSLLLYSLSDEVDHARSKTPPILLRKMSELPASERSAVESIQFSFDSSSRVITLDANSTVRLWDLEVDPYSGKHFTHSKDAFAANVNKYSPPIPAIALTLQERRLHRPPFIDGEEKSRIETEDDGKKKSGVGFFGGGKRRNGKTSAEIKVDRARYVVAPSKSDLTPTTVAFHPSVTALGVQPSFVVGTNCGSVVKWNAIPTSDKKDKSLLDVGKIVHGAPFLDTEPTDPIAKREEFEHSKANKEDLAQDITNYLSRVDTEKGNAVKREFFEFHKTPILFIGFKDHASLSMVVFDDDNWLTIWEYKIECFTGHGWFRPSKKVRLNFVVGEELPSVVEAKLSSSGSELFFLTSYPGILKIFVLDLETLSFLPTIIQHPISKNRR